MIKIGHVSLAGSCFLISEFSYLEITGWQNQVFPKPNPTQAAPEVGSFPVPRLTESSSHSLSESWIKISVTKPEQGQDKKQGKVANAANLLGKRGAQTSVDTLKSA